MPKLTILPLTLLGFALFALEGCNSMAAKEQPNHFGWQKD